MSQAPPYMGEGPHALWHVSEHRSIERFEPAFNERVGAAYVWAIDTRHVPSYWFPRECPRGTFWASAGTTKDDAERLLLEAQRVHAVEAGWLGEIRDVRLVAYRLPEEPFRPFDNAAGYWVATEAVEPLELVDLGDLLEQHGRAGIELRVVPALKPLWERVIASTLEFSGIRLRNADPPIS